MASQAQATRRLCREWSCGWACGWAWMVGILACLFSPQIASAQCSPSWLPGDVGGEIGGTCSAFTSFDPDGPGPRPSLLIAGGGMNLPGYSFQMLYGFDGERWMGLEGTNATGGSVRALAVYNNQLIAAGTFNFVNGMVAFNIAAWNGTTWTPLGAGLNGNVNALAVYNGELYAGGTFTASGSTPTPLIAKWNGSAWSGVGGGISGGSNVVHTLLSFNGLLFAGGRFSQAGSTAASNLATWNGSAWSTFGNPDSGVYTLASWSGLILGSARVFIGGEFNNIGGIAASKTAILRFDPINGNTWTTMGSPGATRCLFLHVRDSGLSFQVNAVHLVSSTNRVYRWTSGTSWTNLASTDQPQCLAVYAGQLVGGAGVASTNAVKSYNGTSWSMLGQIRYPWPLRAMVWTGSDLVATTPPDYFSASSNQFSSVRRRNPSTGVWTDLAATSTSPGATCLSLLSMPNGNIIVGGAFDTYGTGVNNVARWNGTSWTAMGTGMTSSSGVVVVRALVRMPNDDIVAGGEFTAASGVGASNIARWHINVWTPMGGIGGSVHALKVASNGDVYAGGSFTTASGLPASNIARWDGVIWTAMGTGLTGTVSAIEQLPDGSIVASGDQTGPVGQPLATRVVHWNGTAWSPLGTTFTDGVAAGRVRALRVLPTGELVASGRFQVASGTPANNIAKWNGSTWSALNEGLQGANDRLVESLVALPDGTLAAAGTFNIAGTGLSANVAMWGIPPTGCCDPIDFNNDTLTPDSGDLDDFVAVLAGGPSACSTFPVPGCNDIDFNNDGFSPDSLDLDAFLSRLAGGACL